jgi:hypothetical protein
MANSLTDPRTALRRHDCWDYNGINAEFGEALPKRYQEFLQASKQIKDAEDGQKIELATVVQRGDANYGPTLAKYRTFNGYSLTVAAFDLAHDVERFLALLPQRSTKKMPAINGHYRILSGRVVILPKHRVLIVDDFELIDTAELYLLKPMGEDIRHGSVTDAPDLKKMMRETMSDLPRTLLPSIQAATFGAPALFGQTGGGINFQGTDVLTAKNMEFLQDCGLFLAPPMRANQGSATRKLSAWDNDVQLKLTTYIEPSNHQYDPIETTTPQVYQKVIQGQQHVSGERSVVTTTDPQHFTGLPAVSAFADTICAANALAGPESFKGVTTKVLDGPLRIVDDSVMDVYASAKLNPLGHEDDPLALTRLTQKATQSLRSDLVDYGLDHFASGAISGRMSRQLKINIAKRGYAEARANDSLVVSKAEFELATALIMDPIRQALEDEGFQKAIHEITYKLDYALHGRMVAKILIDEPGIDINALYSILKDERDGVDSKLFRGHDMLLDFMVKGEEAGKWAFLNGGYHI